MLLDVLESFRLGKIWQEGVKDTRKSASRMFTPDELVSVATCNERLATSLLAIDRNDREGVDTRGGQIFALNNAAVATVPENPGIFVSTCVINLLCMALNLRCVPSSASAKSTIRALEKFNVMFPQLYISLEPLVQMVNRANARVHWSIESDLSLACSWRNGIERSVEVGFAMDEEISQQVKGFPCLVEVAALTEKKKTYCVHSSLVEMLMKAVKLYSVVDNLAITKLYVEDCRRNKILQEFNQSLIKSLIRSPILAKIG